MIQALKELGHILQPKRTEPDTTPSLRSALAEPEKTIDSYYFTPSLRTLFKEILESAVNRKGQGFWMRAEYGAGKTHFIAALTLLLVNRDETVWNHVHGKEIQRDFRNPLSKLKLFPVTFSLLGAGHADAGDSLVRLIEKEIRDCLPEDLRKKIPVMSEDLAIEWYEKQAGAAVKGIITSHFQSTHKTSPEEFRNN